MYTERLGREKSKEGASFNKISAFLEGICRWPHWIRAPNCEAGARIHCGQRHIPSKKADIGNGCARLLLSGDLLNAGMATVNFENVDAFRSMWAIPRTFRKQCLYKHVRCQCLLTWFTWYFITIVLSSTKRCLYVVSCHIRCHIWYKVFYNV